MEKVALVLYPPLQSPCVLCDQGLPNRLHFNKNPAEESTSAEWNGKNGNWLFPHCTMRGPMPPHMHASYGAMHGETNTYLCPETVQITEVLSASQVPWPWLVWTSPRGLPSGCPTNKFTAWRKQTAPYCLRGSCTAGTGSWAQSQLDGNCTLGNSYMGCTNVSLGCCYQPSKQGKNGSNHW